ncbi:MAG: LacI family DNA-binding transcriptional regulator [Rectinemataceae bacterium]
MDRGRGPNAKIKDVAARAGVSVTTVSRVLNGHPYVREELKSKVERAIEELRYSPSAIARSLVRKSTNLIGVIVPDISASFFSTILGSQEEAATSRGYSILVSNISEDPQREMRYLKVFKEMRVAGIVIMHEAITPAVRRYIDTMDIPIILSSARPLGLKNPSVNIDDEAAAYDAVAYLAGMGHRRIGLIAGGTVELPTTRMRLQGYMRALKDFGIPLDDSIVRFGNFKMQDGYRLMGEILRSAEKPTAVFSMSDDMAAGAMNYIIDEGYSVPRDISVMGFDDSRLAAMTRPALTTVHQPIEEIGSLSIDMLIKSIKGESSLQEVILRHRIVERSSVKRIT